MGNSRQLFAVLSMCILTLYLGEAKPSTYRDALPYNADRRPYHDRPQGHLQGMYHILLYMPCTHRIIIIMQSSVFDQFLIHAGSSQPLNCDCYVRLNADKAKAEWYCSSSSDYECKLKCTGGPANRNGY